jgi:hypothetical protein
MREQADERGDEEERADERGEGADENKRTTER